MRGGAALAADAQALQGVQPSEASFDDPSSEFALLQVQGEPPDFGPPLHLHRDAAEAFYVLEGE